MKSCLHPCQINSTTPCYYMLHTHLAVDLKVQRGRERKKQEAGSLGVMLFAPVRMLPTAADSCRRYGGGDHETVAVGQREAIYSVFRQRNAVVPSQVKRRVEEDHTVIAAPVANSALIFGGNPALQPTTGSPSYLINVKPKIGERVVFYMVVHNRGAVIVGG